MKAFLKTFLLAMLVGSGSMTTGAQSAPSRAPVGLVVTLESSSVCQGGSVAYLVKIINVGKKPIVVDVNRIGSSILIKRADRAAGEKHLDSGEFAISFPIPSHYMPNFVILEPSDSFPVGRTLIIDRNPALGPGRYSVKVFYEQTQNLEFLSAPVWKGVAESRSVPVFVKPCSNAASKVG